MTDASRLLGTLRDGARLVDDDARVRIVDAVCQSANADGGFAGRDGRSDLYYAPYALWVLQSLDAAFPAPERLVTYLTRCADDPALDDTHRASLVQAAALAGCPHLARAVAEGIDGASIRSPSLAFFTAVACASVGRTPPSLGWPNGGVLSRAGSVVGVGEATPALAATVLLLLARGDRAPAPLVARLRDVVDAEGGLRASPRAAAADLLSTATGLFALRAADAMPAALDLRRQVVFVTACWRESGLFASAPSDPDACGDAEYTFHALLALGALAPRAAAPASSAATR